MPSTAVPAVIRKMTERQAIIAETKIKAFLKGADRDLEKAHKMLLDFHRRRGWEALTYKSEEEEGERIPYASFADWAMRTFGMGKTCAYKHLNLAELDESLSATRKFVHIPERQKAQLLLIDSKDREEILEAAEAGGQSLDRLINAALESAPSKTQEAAVRADEEDARKEAKKSSLRHRIKEASSARPLLESCVRAAQGIWDKLSRVRRKYGIACGGRDKRLDAHLAKALQRAEVVEDALAKQLKAME